MFANKLPSTKLIYSTDIHGRNFDQIYINTSKETGPCVIIIRSNNYVMGAYLSHAIRDNNSWTGSPSSYLFSVTLDTKLPFHGKNPVNKNLTTPVAFIANESKIIIGNNDLVLLNTGSMLKNGTSELESCFGVGLMKNSREANCFLAGASHFPVDQMEIWGIIS